MPDYSDVITGPGPSPQSNDLDYSSVFDRSNGIAQQKAVAGTAANADQAGQSITLSKKTGTPASVIDLAPEDFSQRNKEATASKIIQSNPHIADYVNKNPLAAKVSNDDYEHLDKMSKLFDNFGRFAPPQIAPFVQAAPEIFQTAKEALQSIANVPYHFFGPDEAEKLANQTREYLIFEGIDPKRAATEAEVIRGRVRRGESIQGALFGPLTLIGAPVIGAFQHFVSKPLEKATQFPSQATDTLTMAVLAVFGLRSGFKKMSPKTRESLVAGDIPRVGDDPVFDQMRMDQRNIDEAGLDNIIQESQKSKTKTRSADAFTDFTRGKFGAETISISADEIAKLYASENKTPEQGDGLFGYVPGIENQIKNGIASGSEVRVPLADYISHTDPVVHDKIKDFIRFNDNGITKEEAKGIEVYHGSGAEFEAFDTGKIGTGEGAQAYGYGHYLAENRAVAEDYANAANKPLTIKGKPVDTTDPVQHAAQELYFSGGDREKAIKSIESYIKNTEETPESLMDKADRDALVKEWQAVRSALESGKELPKIESEGNIYRARVLRHPDEFLDWDRPLSEQSPQVQKALKDMGFTDNITGQEIYQRLSDIERDRLTRQAESGEITTDQAYKTDAKKLASEKAQSAGIAGIKYLDQGSRDIAQIRSDIAKKEELLRKTPELYPNMPELQKESMALLQKEIDHLKSISQKETRNFVVFSDKDIQITHRNDELLQKASEASAEAGAIAQKLAQVEQELYLSPLIKDAKTVGITDSEFKRYSDKIEKNQAAVLDRIIAAAERYVKKPMTAEWKKNEAVVRQQVETEFSRRPDMAADKFLRTGELPNGQRVKVPKLDAAAVEQALGKDHSLGDLVTKDGIAPDTVAPMVGSPSGIEMLKDLDAYNRGRQIQGLGPQAYRKAAIDKEVDARMQEQFGLLPQKIAEEAREIAMSEYHADILSDEAKFVAKAAGLDPPITTEMMKDVVAEEFGKLRYDQVPTETAMRRAIEKGGRDAEKALLAGKFEDAFKAKQRQRYAFHQFKERKAFQRDEAKLNKSVDTIQSDSSVDRIDSAHVMQGRRILNRLNMNGGAVPDEMMPLADFVRASDGRIAASPWIVLGEDLRTSKDQLNVNEIRDLQKTLQSLLHVGRDVKRMDTTIGNAELENVVKDIKDANARFNLIEQPLAGATVKQRAGALARSVSAANLLPERILDYIDKFNPNGPLSRWLDRPLRKAFSKELEYTESVVKDIKDLREFSDTNTSDLIENQLIRDPLNDNRPLQMDHWNLRKLMLYMGSESGRMKAIRGFFERPGGKKLDPMEIDYYGRQVEKLISDNATANDVKFVNKLFSVHDKLLPDMKELVLQDTGLPMDVVQKRSYSTKAGDVDGGYTKVRYDRDRSKIEEDIRSDQSWFESGYRTITTPHSHTLSRTGYSGFVDLDMSLFASEISSQIHDLTFRTAVRNAGKLINDPNFMMDMRQKWGRQYADMFPQWLRDIANANTVDDTYAKGFIKLLAAFRQNVVSALVGFNIGTMEKHGISAFGMSVKEVGLKGFIEAAKDVRKDAQDLIDAAVESNPELAEFYKSLTTEKGMREIAFARQSSAILRNRMRRYDQTIYGSYDEATANGLWAQAKNLRQLSMWLGRWPISVIDGMSAIPEWISAYKREMAVSGDHDTAVYAADKAVSRSHGSAFIGDAPAIIRQKNTLGGELMRWVTPLYRFWNHNLNMLAGLKWDIGGKFTGRDDPGANWKSIANSLFWIAVIPIIAEEIAAPALDKTKGGLLRAVGRYLGGQLPFVRDISNAVLHGYEPSVGLWGTAAHQMYLAATEVGRRGSNMISRLMTGLAMLTGIGSQPVGKAVQYGTHVIEGKETPSADPTVGIPQVLQGVRTGSQKPRSY